MMSAVSGILMAIQTGALVFLVPLFLADRARLAPARVGMLVGLTAAGRLPALWIGGVLSDRWRRVRVLAPAAALAVWSLASGGVTGIVAPLPTALVGELVPPELLGIAVGWLRTGTDVGHVLGPLGLGALADAVDLSAPFFAGAAILIVLAWRCRRHAAPPRVG